MSKNIIINYRDQRTVRKLGMDALKEKLGCVGAVYFMRQFNTESGNYTKEREALHSGLTFDDIVKGSMEMDSLRQG